jgi:hypothetical protein
MANATKEALWLWQVLSEIGFPQQLASMIMANNQGAIVLSEDQSDHQRTKHIDMCYHFIQERTENGDVAFQYVRSCDNVVDIFTKALPNPTFIRLRCHLGVWPMHKDPWAGGGCGDAAEDKEEMRSRGTACSGGGHAVGRSSRMSSEDTTVLASRRSVGQ